MHYLNLDITLLTVFLVANLVLGLLAGRRVKNLRQYAMGDKNFSTATLTYSIVVSWITGGFFFNALQNIYTSGILYMLVFMGGSLAMLLYGQVLAPRMGEFLNNLSVAEAMRDLYGKPVQIITAISGTLNEIGFLAVQFQAMAKILSIVFNIEGTWVTILAASMAILYASFGGIRSVTITDIFQFVSFTTVLPILALIIWNHIKDPSQVAKTLTMHSIFSIRETVGWNANFLSALGLMTCYMIPNMTPAIFQRVVIARDLNQVKQAFTYSAAIRTLILLVLAWIAILLLSHDAHLAPSKLTNHLIKAYAYPGLKGFIAIALIAKAMSAADANLNSSSVLLINDIIKPLRPSFTASLLTIRIIALLIGTFALILSIQIKGLLKLALWGGSKYVPIVTVPLLLAIFGFRTSRRAVLIGMVAGCSMVLFWDHILSYQHIPSLTPGMLANLVFLLGSHYLLKEQGGWIGIKEPAPLIASRQATRDSWNAFRHVIQQPTKLYGYLQKNLPHKEGIYALFALYVLGATYISFFTLSGSVISQHQKLYTHITYSVLITTAIFLSYPTWPHTLRGKRFIVFAWPLGIAYIFFVVGSILIVMNGFHQIQVMLFILNLVVAALLIDWPLMIGLILGGILVAVGMFHGYQGNFPLAEVSSILQFKSIYGIPIFISLLLAIIKNRQAKNTLAAQNSYLLNHKRESENQLAEVLAYKAELIKELELNEASLFDQATADYIQYAVYRLTDYLRLRIQPITLHQLVDEVKALLKLQGFDIQPQILIRQQTQQETIQVDGVKIQQLLVQSIAYIQLHNTLNKPISIFLEDAKLGYSIQHMQGYTRKLAALKLVITTHSQLPTQPAIYLVNSNKPSTWLPNDEKDLSLVENARIIDAHYGYLDVASPHLHIYVIPVNVREVRGQVMELLREPAVADPEEMNHPLAINLEQQLFDRLKGTAVNVTTIQKALNTIKKYHSSMKRKSGEPFFTNPIQVALIVMEYVKDQDAIVAALLHDTVEDTSLSMAHIKMMFGEQVAFIVSKLTNLEDNLRRVNLKDYENLYRLMNYEDERAALVKLADRLHNMRTILAHSSIEKQQYIAQETLQFFVPLARQLAFSAIAQELEALSLNILGQ